MKEYNHKKIEKKWQREWAKSKIYKTTDKNKGKKNFYTLVEIPYPSGNLHVGHWYAFSVPDIFARYKRMSGENVMFPIGFDAFGLPAENAAIKKGLNPRKWTYDNIKYMENQLQSMGASFDWSRKVVTADPEYYRFTQWMFNQFFKNGLAYQKKTPANWCPSCKTVLANEQVVDGKCERCDSKVEKKEILQWNLKITDYAERLLSGLDNLSWPEPIKNSQRNWIGKSDGAEIEFQLLAFSFQKDSKLKAKSQKLAAIKVFTTRPDTIFGATYLVISPEKFQEKLRENSELRIMNYEEVRKYTEQTKKKTEIERTAEGKVKTGVELKGIKAVNPASNEEIPVWIADHVLPQYGTGAIMAVPAHDERDFQFAKKYNLPIRQVIEPSLIQTAGSSAFKQGENFVEGNSVIVIIKHWSEDKYLGLRWREAPDWGTLLTGGIEEGMTAEETARKEVLEETGYKNFKKILDLGKTHVKFYHGPKKINKFVHADVFYVELQDGECVEVDELEKNRHEPVWMTLEKLESFLTAIAHQQAIKSLKGIIYSNTGLLTNSGKFNSLDSEEAKNEIIKFVGGTKKTTYKLRDWGVSRQRYWGVPIPIIHCEKCGQVPVPDKDLPVKLPEIKDYLPRDDGKSPLAKAEKWVKTKCPKCKGKAERETDTLDTFVDSSWYFLRYTDPKNKKEFASKKKMENWMPVDFYSGGAEHNTMHLLYSRFWQKALYDSGLVKDEEPYKMRMNRGLILGPDGNKMSKSKGNVVDPDEIVRNLGADTIRMYLAFIGPFNEVGSFPWSTDGIVGVRRFLEKVWNLKNKLQMTNDKTQKKANPEIENLMHQTIKKVGEDIESLKMNTAVSQLMIFVNALTKQEKIFRKEFEILLLLLAPFAPHLTEELWHKLGNPRSIHLTLWPKYDQSKIQGSKTKIGIQIDGKIRDILEVENDASEDEIKSKALESEAVKKWLANREVKKIIYIKGKILSIVLT